jgi:NADH:ubiquinone reductase (H+-translocating)
MTATNWKARCAGAVASVCAGWTVWRNRQLSPNAFVATGKRIVVLGAGFGGAEAARELARLLPQDANGEIILVDRHQYLLFTPMLTQAVGGEVEAHHIIVPVNHLLKRVKFIKGEIEAINPESRSVTINDGESTTIAADHLVLAMGATANFHGIPGVEELAFPIKTLDDAYSIRQSALSLIKAAAEVPPGDESTAMLTFIVAGGGYTGVETIAALNDLLTEQIAAYPTLGGSRLRMIIAEPMDRLMTEITPDLAAYAQQQLEAAGIEIKLKTGIKQVDGDEIEFTTGEKVRARTLIWTAGIEPNPLTAALEVPKSKKKAVQVDASLQLNGFVGVWAIGDCAAVPQAGKEEPYAPTAQNATREGVQVARNIVHSLKGEPLQDFRYTPIGELALVGRRKAVARVYKQNFAGLPAWLMWRAVYIAKLPSVPQRLRVLNDWISNFLLGPVAEYHYVATKPKKEAAQLTEAT